MSVVPFRMAHVARAGCRTCPGLAFPELNLRTYAMAAGKPGVWFFSLDAANPAAVALARAGFHLPYFRAAMSLRREGEAVVYGPGGPTAARQWRGSGGAMRRWRAFGAAPGTLDHWLTERYCLYAASATKLYCGEIHHPVWRLQRATLALEENTVATASGLVLSDVPPLLHFSARQDVLAWRPTRIH